MSGIRVLEFGYHIAGPFCTQNLADQGADVIKVEPPGGGRAVLDALVRSADALITNYGNGLPPKLGFGYDRLHQVNPRLVFVHSTGFVR